MYTAMCLRTYLNTSTEVALLNNLWINVIYMIVESYKFMQIFRRHVQWNPSKQTPLDGRQTLYTGH